MLERIAIIICNIVTKKGIKNNSNYLKRTAIGAVWGIIGRGIVFGFMTFKAFPSIDYCLGITVSHTLIGTFYN